MFGGRSTNCDWGGAGDDARGDVDADVVVAVVDPGVAFFAPGLPLPQAANANTAAANALTTARRVMRR